MFFNFACSHFLKLCLEPENCKKILEEAVYDLWAIFERVIFLAATAAKIQPYCNDKHKSEFLQSA